jgi:hypothetical protein
VEPKPVPTIAIITDAHAAAEYSSAVEAWGERGWNMVARNCRWAQKFDRTVKCPDAKR